MVSRSKILGALRTKAFPGMSAMSSILIATPSFKVIVACDKAGVRVTKQIDDPLKRRMSSTKLGDCKFRVVLRAPRVLVSGEETNGGWTLESIQNEHNHMPVAAVKQFRRSATRPNELQKSVIRESTVSSMTVAETHHALKRRGLGDNHNYKSVAYQVRLFRDEMNGSGCKQAKELIEELKTRFHEDGRWLYDYDVHPETHVLERVFWISPERRVLYLQYSDVLINDNTAKTNHFGTYLNVSVIIDDTYPKQSERRDSTRRHPGG
ncbi:hypothetical protein BGZ68_001513 [Mortierella alpina]|nr:hypothetical protein BGZ68_001513 [Mortierella alpina]